MTTASVRHPLRGTRILSLALNLPGPAALMRLRAMGARCLKVEPPAAQGAAADAPGDPMAQYSPAAYAALHAGIPRRQLDLKSERGQAALHRELARCDLLLTSFRPSALAKLGLEWKTLQRRHPQLSLVSIVGGPAALAEVPGHDLTYLAEAGLVPGLDLPATLFADMGGALLASEAALRAVLAQRSSGRASCQQVALSEAAAWLALARQWGLSAPGGWVGGAHAGYRVYPCRDGRVAVAALEPHFAARLCAAAGLPAGDMQAPATHQAIAGFLATRTRSQLARLAATRDIPLYTLPGAGR